VREETASVLERNRGKEGVMSVKTSLVKMDDRIRNVLPRHTEAEKAICKTRLQVDGCLYEFPYFRLDGAMVQLDGHQTREYCIEMHVPIKGWYEVKLTTIEQAIEWAVNAQLGRRNLTDEQQRYYRGKEFLEARKPFGGRFVEKPNDSTVVQTAPPLPISNGSTAETLGDKHGVSADTIKRDAAFAAALDKLSPEERATILAGASGMTREEVIELAKPKAKKKRKKKRKKKVKPEANGTPEPTAEEPAKPAPEPMKDKEGIIVPDVALPAFETVKEISKKCRELDAIVAALNELVKVPGGRLIHPSVMQSIQAARKTLWASRAKHVCPRCQGTEKKCAICKGEGWTNGTGYSQHHGQKGRPGYTGA
jgi:hypothetical protein